MRKPAKKKKAAKKFKGVRKERWRSKAERAASAILVRACDRSGLVHPQLT
jgi:hypothetical protein